MAAEMLTICILLTSFVHNVNFRSTGLTFKTRVLNPNDLLTEATKQQCKHGGGSMMVLRPKPSFIVVFSSVTQVK